MLYVNYASKKKKKKRTVIPQSVLTALQKGKITST